MKENLLLQNAMIISVFIDIITNDNDIRSSTLNSLCAKLIV